MYYSYGKVASYQLLEEILLVDGDIHLDILQVLWTSGEEETHRFIERLAR